MGPAQYRGLASDMNHIPHLIARKLSCGRFLSRLRGYKFMDMSFKEIVTDLAIFVYCRWATETTAYQLLAFLCVASVIREYRAEH